MQGRKRIGWGGCGFGQGEMAAGETDELPSTLNERRRQREIRPPPSLAPQMTGEKKTN